MEMTFAPSFVKLSQKLVFKSQKELSLRIWPYTRRQCGNKYDFVPASAKLSKVYIRKTFSAL